MRHYLAHEDAIILKYAEQKHGVCEAACELPHRSLSSVENRRKRLLGIKKPSKTDKTFNKRINELNKSKQQASVINATNNSKPWKTTEIEFLKTSKLPRQEQARILGRSFLSVCQKVRLLNKQEREKHEIQTGQ